MKLNIKYLKSGIQESGNMLGQFVLTDLNKGQGLTLGNALRRELLSNIEGTAITAIKIPNAVHAFSSITGIREDILEIMLNLKQIVLKTKSTNTISGKISAQGPGIITASCLKFDDNVKIINPNQYIGTITMNKKIDFDIIVDHGVGYNFGSQDEQKYKNFLSIDAIFAPVVNVNFKIHISRLWFPYRKRESLILDITTNGSITPEEALRVAAQQLMKMFSDLIDEKTINKVKQISNLKSMRIEELHLSTRACNCLKSSGINYVYDLLDYSKEDFKEIKNFGTKLADEVFNVLKDNYNIILPSVKY